MFQILIKIFKLYVLQIVSLILRITNSFLFLDFLDAYGKDTEYLGRAFTEVYDILNWEKGYHVTCLNLDFHLGK